MRIVSSLPVDVMCVVFVKKTLGTSTICDMCCEYYHRYDWSFTVRHKSFTVNPTISIVIVVQNFVLYSPNTKIN